MGGALGGGTLGDDLRFGRGFLVLQLVSLALCFLFFLVPLCGGVESLIRDQAAPFRPIFGQLESRLEVDVEQD